MEKLKHSNSPQHSPLLNKLKMFSTALFFALLYPQSANEQKSLGHHHGDNHSNHKERISEPQRKDFCTVVSIDHKNTIEINTLFSDHRLQAAKELDHLINQKKYPVDYRECIFHMIHWIDQQQHDSKNAYLVDIKALGDRILALNHQHIKKLLLSRPITHPTIQHHQHNLEEIKKQAFIAHYHEHQNIRQTSYIKGGEKKVLEHLPYEDVIQRFQGSELQFYSTALGTQENGKKFDRLNTHLAGLTPQAVECIIQLHQECQKLVGKNCDFYLEGATESGHSGGTTLEEWNAVGGNLYHHGRVTAQAGPAKMWHGIGLSFDLLLTEDLRKLMTEKYGIMEIGKLYDVTIGNDHAQILLHDSNGNKDNHAIGLHYHVQVKL